MTALTYVSMLNTAFYVHVHISLITLAIYNEPSPI